MAEDLEVLVHVSAPISKRDDDHYQRLAQASLGFEPSNTIDILSRANIPDSTEAVADEQTEGDVVAHLEAPPLVGVPVVSRNDNDGEDSLGEYWIANDNEAVKALESQLITSSLSISDLTPPSESIERPANLKDTEIKDQVLSQAATDASSGSLVSDTSFSKHVNQLVDPDADKSTSFTQLPPFATPPEVKVGLARFSPSLFALPPLLSDLSRKLSAKYRLRSQTRKIARYERGYWLIHTSCWSQHRRLEVWQILSSLIRCGKCGLGVSAYRVADTSEWSGNTRPLLEHVHESSDAQVADLQEESLDALQVFCFGKAVKDVYLLICSISKGSLSGTRATWVDARGEMVIRIE